MGHRIHFLHGMAYASLILVSMFAYGMYTAQLRAHPEAQQVALYGSEDYLTTIATAKGK